MCIKIHYEISSKSIDIITNFYDASRCAVRLEGEVCEWFQIVTGVRQRYELSPMILVLVVDMVMTRVEVGGDTGLKQVSEDKLRYLNFADDIAQLDSSLKGLAVLTYGTQEELAKVGLTTNPDGRKIE